MDALCVFLKLLNDHFHRIRNFLVIIQQNLLADNLRHEKTGRLVRPLVLVEVRRRIRQQVLDALHHHIHPELRNGRYWNDFGLWNQCMPFFHTFHQGILIAQINLIDKQKDRNLHLAHLFDELHVLVRLFHHIRHIEQHIRIRQCRLREIQH